MGEEQGEKMALLKPAVNQTAFLKIGLYGFQGSGKTYTACDFAIGMAKLTGKNKVAFFDTEKGSDFHIPRFKKEGVELFVVKSKSFVDLMETIKEAERHGFSFLIIDSVTHIWRELTEGYLKSKQERVQRFSNSSKKPIVNLTMKDWQTLKTEWAQFSDIFVNSKLHIAVCGRAGYEYDVSEDEEGKQEIVKSGTKMKAEGEFGYESDILLEMYKVPLAEAQQNKKIKGFINRCIVLKDRTDTMNAKVIDKPKFKDFMPIVKFINIGGDHVGAASHTGSDEIFGPQDRSIQNLQRRRQIAIESLQEALILGGLDGRSSDANKQRTELLIEIFGSSSKTKIEEEIQLEDLEHGVYRVKVKLGQIKNPVPETQPEEMPS